MTPEELKELRGWAARKMGYRDMGAYYYRGPDQENLPKHLWQPDRKETGQIWMLVKRMMELGFSYKLGDNIPPHIQYCEFWKSDSDRFIEGRAYDHNPCLAILKAAKATED